MPTIDHLSTQTHLGFMFLSLHASIVNVHGSLWLHFEPLHLLILDFDADLGPDPAFHSHIDPDPDPQHWSQGSLQWEFYYFMSIPVLESLQLACRAKKAWKAFLDLYLYLLCIFCTMLYELQERYMYCIHSFFVPIDYTYAVLQLITFHNKSRPVQSIFCLRNMSCCYVAVKTVIILPPPPPHTSASE